MHSGGSGGSPFITQAPLDSDAFPQNFQQLLPAQLPAASGGKVGGIRDGLEICARIDTHLRKAGGQAHFLDKVRQSLHFRAGGSSAVARSAIPQTFRAKRATFSSPASQI